MSPLTYDDGRAYIRDERGEWGVAMLIETPKRASLPKPVARTTLADWLMAIALGLLLGALAGAGF